MKPMHICLVCWRSLLSVVIEGLQWNDWTEVPVIAVETKGADALAQAIRAEKRVELASLTSIATSLAASPVCEQAYASAEQLQRWSNEPA